MAPRRRPPGKLSPVSVAETLLVYVGIPLAIVLVMAALIFLPGGRKRPRWKSGQPWAHEPVWFEPHPEATGIGHGDDAHGDAHADGHAALPGGHGATAIGAGPTAAAPAPAPVTAGPLGGARGTW
jgi:hypothetical protein